MLPCVTFAQEADGPPLLAAAATDVIVVLSLLLLLTDASTPLALLRTFDACPSPVNPVWPSLADANVVVEVSCGGCGDGGSWSSSSEDVFSAGW